MHDEIRIRPFRRSDRDQLTALVNAHVAAVVPGAAISVNAVLSQIEREPDEFIVDPWVVDRVTLVAEEHGRVAAAVHLLHYGDGEEVGVGLRGAGAVRWLLFWPLAPAGSRHWSSGTAAAGRLLEAAIEQLGRWNASRQLADPSLPAPGVYGVPAQWPHVRSALEAAGFHCERTGEEIVFVRVVDEIDPPGEPPIAGLGLRREVGINGTRFTALLDGEPVGFVETEILDAARRSPSAAGWADIGNLHVDAGVEGRGIERWLLAHVGGWLRLAGVGRLLDYAKVDEHHRIALLEGAGFLELTRIARGWERRAGRGRDV